MTVFAVLLTHDAARGLGEIYDYIAFHDSPQNADSVLEQIDKIFSSLFEFPERGAYTNVHEHHHGRIHPRAWK